MLHVLIGFQTHRKDSSGRCLYVGTDSQAVKDALEANREKFGIVRLFKNPSVSKRWIGGGEQDEVEEEPQDDGSADALLTLIEEMKAKEAELLQQVENLGKGMDGLTEEHEALKENFRNSEGGRALAEQEMNRLNKELAAKAVTVTPETGTLTANDSPSLLPDTSGTVKDAKGPKK